MAEEKSSSKRRRSKSSKSKRTKDAEPDADADVNMKTLEPKQEDDSKENAVERGERGAVAAERKHRDNKKRRLAEQDEQAQIPLSDEKKEEDRGEPKTKKKRVSFSAEAKVKSPSPVEGDEEAEADDENGDSSKKEKKKKKKKNKEKGEEVKGDMDSTSTRQKSGESSVLAYLSQYYNDRSSWKFQKIREIQLFKHILSLEHVPATYDAAILSYLKGLRGEAAKQRLRELAQAAIKADVEELKEVYVDLSERPVDDQEPSPTENYKKAVYAFRTKLTAGELTDDLGEAFEKLNEEMLQRFRKRRRAEIVYFAVDGKVFTMSNLKAPPQKGKNDAPNQQVIKKKKNRTAVVEISSSSDSDSDSDDEKKSSTEPEYVKKQPVKRKKKKKTRTAVIEFSSSSESSSSDSDS
ncbi:WKF domain-containing protein [Aspergillus foveolatus]|uniref:WKF domain-containing protein n=1 Tax=Aspergillus foveolatus TaxID=210207 RepID=UPI003CCE42C9